MIADDVCAFLDRYVKLPSTAARDAIALWVIHTHAIDAFDVTPYLAITSPQKRCGKTRLLEVLKVLVPRPWHAAGVTEAVLFRRIERDFPTLLLDEVDTQLRERNDRAEGLRGLLNAGFERGAVVSRCVGKNFDLKDFNVFCPKVLAGIGSVPDTIADRSIPIAMQRKRPGERLIPFRRRQVQGEVRDLIDDLARWGDEWTETLRATRPTVPDELNDRQRDGWEPLFAIAEALGGEWLTRARLAALELAGGASDDTADAGLLALRGLREAFVEAKAETLHTVDALAALVARDDAPFAGWWGRDVADGRTQGPAAKLARLLRPFGIMSKTVRIGTRTAKGYTLADCRDAFERYLSLDLPEAVTAVTPSHAAPVVAESVTAPVSAVTAVNGQAVTRGVTSAKGCDAVTAVTAPARPEREPGEDDGDDDEQAVLELFSGARVVGRGRREPGEDDGDDGPERVEPPPTSDKRSIRLHSPTWHEIMSRAAYDMVDGAARPRPIITRWRPMLEHFNALVDQYATALGGDAAAMRVPLDDTRATVAYFRAVVAEGEGPLLRAVRYLDALRAQTEDA